MSEDHKSSVVKKLFGGKQVWGFVDAELAKPELRQLHMLFAFI